jgi:urease accessory protein
VAFPTAFAFAARQWGIEPREALLGYLWSWLENQVMAAVKGVPLGQTAGQKILLSIGNSLPSIAEQAMESKNLANFAPGLAMLSTRHETQYSRIFRS